MGSCSSKPTKPSRKISKPSPHIPLNPLSAPYYQPLPLRPLPHHPTAKRPSPEQELAARYGALLKDNPTFAGTRKPEPAHRPPTRRGEPARPSPARTPLPKSAAQTKGKAPYQFRPLNEIGAATSNGKGKGAARSQLPKQARFGGLKQDAQGEWWVLVLAEKRWRRARDVGVKPPPLGGR